MSKSEAAPKGGKRSEKRQRTEQFRVRLTPEERAKFTAAAEEAGLDLAALIRQRVIGSKGPRTRARQMTADFAALARLRGDLGYLGNNLNQLTRLANIGDMDRPADLDRALREVVALLNQVRAAMNGGAE